MSKITQQLRLYVDRENIIAALIAKQYDKSSRFVEVELWTSDDKQIVVESTSSVVINARRADKATKTFAGTVNASGSVTVPITYWMLQLDDMVNCDVSIYNGDTKLSTTTFKINVQRSNGLDDADISTDDDYDILLKLIKDTDAIKTGLTDLTVSAAKATTSATSAAKSANDATVSAKTATANANKAVENVSTAIANANTATQSATEAATKAMNAAKSATDSATNLAATIKSATDATKKATDAASSANTASSSATTAASNANKAAASANDAASKAIAATEKVADVQPNVGLVIKDGALCVAYTG